MSSVSDEDLEDYEDEDEEPQSLLDKLKAKLKGNKTSPKKSGEEKKAPNKVVIIGAVVLMAFVLLWDDKYLTMFEEEPVAIPEIKPRYKKKVVKPESPKVEEAPAETADVPAESTEPADTSTSSDASSSVAEAPGEQSPSTEDSSQEPTAPSTNGDPTISEIELSDVISEDPPLTEPTEPISEIPTVEPDPSITDIDEPSYNGENNLTDKILQDLEKQAGDIEKKAAITEYVSPPDYEYRGRGLIYNCTGKHWACVDAPSYKLCEDNQESVKYLKRPVECHPYNVYETQRGCERMQYQMISSSTKTPFCD